MKTTILEGREKWLALELLQAKPNPRGAKRPKFDEVETVKLHKYEGSTRDTLSFHRKDGTIVAVYTPSIDNRPGSWFTEERYVPELAQEGLESLL